MRSVQSSRTGLADEERGVDAIEVVVGDHERRQAGDGGREVRAGSRIGASSVAGGSGTAPSGRRALAIEEGPAADPRDERGDPDGPGPDDERAARPVGHRRGGRRSGALRRHEPAQDPESDADRHRARDGDDRRRSPRGSPSAARKPRTPNAPKASDAMSDRRVARIPRPAPMRSATRTMTISRASLSLVPNRPTTNSLAPGGWMSMTTWPTAATSEVAPGSRPARSSEVPRAAATATAPPTAARAFDVVTRAACRVSV